MAKKKSVPKKKSCTKSCGKCQNKNCKKNKKEINKLTKTDYFFDLIKKAFGHE